MGHPKFKTCHMTYPHPFQARFVVRRLGLATVNLYTKYEVSMFTRMTDYSFLCTFERRLIANPELFFLNFCKNFG